MRTCLEGDPACVAGVLMMAMLGVGLVFAVVRLLRGPSTPDRVVALDLAAVLSVGMIAVYAVLTHEPALLSGALVVGLITFLGTVAFAQYLEKQVP